MYSWHKEFYHKAFDKTYSSIMKKLSEAEIKLVDFWTWIEAAHPDAYKKYQAAGGSISSLCKDTTPQGMEEFKKATKIEMEATAWAVDEYIEHHKKLEEVAAA